MEERAISFIESTLFEKTTNLSDSEYRVRLQNVEELARELIHSSDNKVIKQASVQREADGIFFFFEHGIPDPVKLGNLFIEISRQYPVEKKIPKTINRRNMEGHIRTVMPTEGVLLVISKVAPSGGTKWLISAFILFLVELFIFAYFASDLSPAKDFASLRLYLGRR